jgi:hypothetical protein
LQFRLPQLQHLLRGTGSGIITDAITHGAVITDK